MTEDIRAAAGRTVADGLIRYFQIREQHRSDKIATVLAGLTDRERALVREAAVMGFVRGARFGRDQEVPRDSRILAEVIDACMSFPDLYPTIAKPGGAT